MLKILFSSICFIISSISFACYSDYNCGYGNRCVKPSGSYSLTGTCVKLVDQFGNQYYKSNSN